MAGQAEIAAIDKARASAICDRIRENMTSARDLLVELYEGRGWEALGYKSWRECATAEFGRHEQTLYCQLKAAKVARELKASADDGVFMTRHKNEPSDEPASPDPDAMSDRQLRALAKAPEGTRAEVLRAASVATEGKPTEKAVKAAVAAKLSEPDAPAETLVRAVKAAVAPEPNAIVNGVPDYDPGVAKLRAAGRIPAGVEVVVDAPVDAAYDPADAAMEHEERAAKADELSDDEWLATLPLSSKLSGVSLKRYRLDALHYRGLESTRRRLMAANTEARNKAYRGSPWKGGAVQSAVSWWLRMEHPKDWHGCPPEDKGGCGGSGTVPVFGGDCPACKGRGYIAR